MKILTVDDEPAINRIVQFSLSRLGHQVVPCASGKEALDKCADGLPDMVILDVMMPEVDGLEVCRRLRERDSQLPIIFLTARNEQFQGEYAEVGATEWILKPCSLKEILGPVHRYGSRQAE